MGEKIFFAAELSAEQQQRMLNAVKNAEPIEKLISATAYDESNKQVSHAIMTGVIKPKK